MRKVIKNIVAYSIESSCDDTCYSSFYESSGKLISKNFSFKHSSFLNFFGGVYPRLSSLFHFQTYSESNIKPQINLVALTFGPGIKECLNSGDNFTRSRFKNDLIKPVNHLHSHLIVSLPTNFFNYPFLGLVLSGGHTIISLCISPGSYIVLGQSYDDSIGECYEKVLRGLFPNKLGSNFHQLIQDHYQGTNKFPNSYLDINTSPKTTEFPYSLNFSFCGMKTFYSNQIKSKDSGGFCFTFMNHLIEMILNNIFKSLLILRESIYFPKCIVFGGGFSSNEIFRELCFKNLSILNLKMHFPAQRYSVDNSFMIGKTSLYDIKYKIKTNENKKPKEKWGLNELKCDE
jgi:N6-L-threonylcarbamoyladenine synthase